ncbi:MAG: type II toxin-antitoxin system Phd/YefM family antitoxin [Prosthecobacter sp.]
MNMVLNADVLSMTEFASDVREYSARLKQKGRATVLTQDGEAAAVLVPVEAYEKMAWEAHEHQMDQRLKAAVEGYANGERGSSAREFFDSLYQEDDKTAESA